MPLDSGLLLWVVGALVGSMLFFGIVVAPIVFRALPTDAAGDFLRALFPNYYLWGIALAVIAAAIAAVSDWASSALCVLIAVMFGCARQWLMPKINLSRDAALGGDRTASVRFDKLHRLSVLINGLQLLLLLVIAGHVIW